MDPSEDDGDLLPWRIKKRRRRRGGLALVAVQPRPPPPTPPANGRGMELAVRIADRDLSPKKRWLQIQAQTQTRIGDRVDNDPNPFVCGCGRGFKNPRALGAHKGHHARREKRRRRAEEGGEEEGVEEGPGEVADEPPPAVVTHQQQQEVCLGCGRAFSNRRAIGGHKRHCKGPPARRFDLNRDPSPEPDQAPLALPWVDRVGGSDT